MLAGTGLGEADGDSEATGVLDGGGVEEPDPPDAPDGIGGDVAASCVSAIASAALTVVTVCPAGAGWVTHQTTGAAARMASPTTRLGAAWWWDNQVRLRAWW